MLPFPMESQICGVSTQPKNLVPLKSPNSQSATMFQLLSFPLQGTKTQLDEAPLTVGGSLAPQDCGPFGGSCGQGYKM